MRSSYRAIARVFPNGWTLVLLASSDHFVECTSIWQARFTITVVLWIESSRHHESTAIHMADALDGLEALRNYTLFAPPLTLPSCARGAG